MKLDVELCFHVGLKFIEGCITNLNITLILLYLHTQPPLSDEEIRDVDS